MAEEETQAQAIEELRNELTGEIRRGFIKTVVASTIAAAGLLVGLAALGWWFYFEDRMTALVSGVPDHAVVAFDDASLDPEKCPDGWEPFSLGHGRTIIGAGSGEDLSAREFRDAAGEEAHLLLLNELPSRAHNTIRRGNASISTSGVRDDFVKSAEHFQNAAVGRPHNNMPPYIALYLCKKQAG